MASAGDSIETKLDRIAGKEQEERGRRGGPSGAPTLGSVRTQLARVEHEIQNADEAPTASQVEAYQIASKPLDSLLEQWNQLKQNDLKELNLSLERAHLPLLRLDTRGIDHGVEDQIELGDED